MILLNKGSHKAQSLNTEKKSGQGSDQTESKNSQSLPKRQQRINTTDASRKEEGVEYDDKLPEAIVVDIDGTLAHIVGDNPRSPYDASRAHEDALDDSVSLITELMYQHGYRVIVLTGRHSGHLQVTEEWLDAKGVNYDEIYCREEGDKRPDYIVKEELYRSQIKDKVNVKFAIEDRPQVVRMWQRLGIKVFNVGAIDVEF